MEVEDEVESRRKLDEPRKKLQMELRDVDRLSFVSKEMQESIMESLQHQMQEVEKRRHDLMPEHQKFQKMSQKIQSIQDKRKHMQKKMLQRKKRCGSYVMRSSRKRSVSFFCRIRSRIMRWQMQTWQRNFRGCRQEKKGQQCLADRR